MGYCYLLADRYNDLHNIIRQQFKSDTPYPENTNYYGLTDYYVTESGMYTGGMTYQSRALYLSPLFFTALNRKYGINLYDEDNSWNCDLVSKMVKQTLIRIDPQFHHLNQEDDWRYSYHSEEIEHCLIPYYYNSDEFETNQHIEWYITKLKDKIGEYPLQWFEHDQGNQFAAVMSYNYNRNYAVNHTIPEFLENSNYSDGELSVLRPELTTLDFNSDGNITTPQLFVNHENSITTYHPDDDKTHFQLYYGGEYFIIDTGYMPWLSPFGRGLDWHSSAYSKNRIIINPDSSETYENAGGGISVGEYKDLEEIWYYAGLSTPVTNINYKGPRSYYGIGEYNQDIDPANKLYLLENEKNSHLKIHVTDPNPEGRFDSGIENPCDVYRNFYMIDNNYYIIYDEIENQSNHENKYRNQIHLNNTDDSNVSIIIDPNNIGCDNIFIEEINSKYLHGLLGAINEFTTYFDDQNMPLGWIPNIDLDYHSRLRITSENPTIDEQFITLLIPSENDTNPIDDISPGTGQYVAKYSLNTGYNCYAAVSDGNDIYCDSGNTLFVTDASFLLVEANNTFTDLKKIILNSDNFLEIRDISGTRFSDVLVFDSDYDSEEVIAEWSENYELEITTVMSFASPIPLPIPNPKYKILRCGVLPENLISKTHYYATGSTTPQERGTIGNNIENLAYDDNYFYVNYSYSDFLGENLLTSSLTIHQGTFDGITISGTTQFGLGDIVLGNTILVPENSELVFLPGATPKFYSDLFIKVSGNLIANGTETSPIIFDKYSNDNWEEIKVEVTGNAFFDFCSFSNGAYPLSVYGYVDLSNCTFNNNERGIILESPKGYQITNSEISNCTYTGLITNLSDT